MNPYANNFIPQIQYNPQQSIQRLNKMKEDIDSQLQMLGQQPITPIQQNFNLQPQQSNNDFDGKIIKSEKELDSLVLKDTVFFDLDNSKFYFKKVDGNIKHYEFKEIIILDEKDKKIQELENKINELMEVNKNESTNNNANVNVKNSTK